MTRVRILVGHVLVAWVGFCLSALVHNRGLTIVLAAAAGGFLVGSVRSSQ